MANGPAVGADRRIALVRTAVKLRQSRFVIERIHMARCPIHEQKDRVLGLRSKMRLPGSEQIGSTNRGGLVCRLGMAGEETVARQEIDQRETGETSADFPKKLPARPAAGCRIRNVTTRCGRHRF